MTQAAESHMAEQRREPDEYSPTQIEAARLVVELGRDLGYPEDTDVAAIAALSIPEPDYDNLTPTQIEAAHLVLELGRDLGYPEDPIATRVVATAEQ